MRLLGLASVGLVAPRFVLGSSAGPSEDVRVARWLLWNVADRTCLGVAAPRPAGEEVDAVVRSQRSASDDDRAAAELWQPLGGVPVWTRALLEKIQSQRTDPVKAARALALLHTAVCDAIVLTADARLAHPRDAPFVASRLVRASAKAEASSYPSTHAAVAGAASTVLAYLYPGLTTSFPRGRQTFHEAARDAVHSQILLGHAYATDGDAGLSLGERVGIAAVERARVDGSLAMWTPSGDPTIPQSPIPELQLPERENVRPTGPRYWVPTPPAYHFPPLHPLAGNWRPWVLHTGAQFVAPRPPALDEPFPSKRFLAEAQEVKAVVSALTAEQKRIARFWADNPGSSPTPPGHWAREVLGEVTRLGLSTAASARVLALVSVGLADAAICCWANKYRYWVVRPVTAIRTMAGQPFHDPNFDSLVLTPPFPAYTSGHATFSGCAAAVLESLLPQARIGDAAGARVEPAAAAEEAAMSRLYGGIHYRSDNDEGLTCGRKVAEVVLARARRDEGGA